MPGAAIDRLMRANRTILAVPVVELSTGVISIVSPTGTTAPLAAPSSAILDAWRAIVTANAAGAGRGGNISCALLDDVTLGFGDSDTDTELTICSVGNEADPTFASADITLTALRDKSLTDTGVFNLATQLLKAPDVRYAFFDRIGYASTAAFAVGQIVNAFDTRTDNPVDIKEDRGNLKIQQTPIFLGNFLQNYALLT